MLCTVASVGFSQGKQKKSLAAILNTADSLANGVKKLFPGKKKKALEADKGTAPQTSPPGSERRETGAITSEQVDYDANAAKYGQPQPGMPENYSPFANYRDSLTTLYNRIAKGKTISLAIAPFFDAVPFKAPDKMLAKRLIAYVQAVPGFKVAPDYVNFVPGGTQVLVTGTFRDYYESGNSLGRPRIQFEMEIRSAADQKLIKKYTVKKEGALYSGKGTNTALESLWHECMFEATLFLLNQHQSMALLPKATEEKVAIYDSLLYFQDRVQTESILTQQQRHSDVKRERDRQWSLGLSEYYNDSVIYNTYPKRISDEFIEYTVNGVKYQYNEQTSKLEKWARLQAMQGIKFSVRDGLRINVSGTHFVGEMNLTMFDPSNFPTVRRFYFGEKDMEDKQVPGSREPVEMTIKLLGAFKEDKFNFKDIPSEKYSIVATNKPQNLENNTISAGYVQILHFETGDYGVIELVFWFRTKRLTDKSGNVIPERTIEGRIRARGSIRPPVRF